MCLPIMLEKNQKPTTQPRTGNSSQEEVESRKMISEKTEKTLYCSYCEVLRAVARVTFFLFFVCNLITRLSIDQLIQISA